MRFFLRASVVAISCASLIYAPGVLASPGYFVDSQHGYGVTAYGAGVEYPGARTLFRLFSRDVDLFWRARIARWTSRNADARSLWDVAATPVLRMQSSRREAVIPYAEIGLGIHLLSHVNIGDRKLGTAFHFGEHAAVGVRFGEEWRNSVALRAEHVSNAHIKLPNDGVSFYGVELQLGW